MVEHSNGSSGGFGSSMLVHGFQSHGGTPNHPVVMDDHDFAGLVLKPVLTQEPRILNSSILPKSLDHFWGSPKKPPNSSRTGSILLRPQVPWTAGSLPAATFLYITTMLG